MRACVRLCSLLRDLRLVTRKSPLCSWRVPMCLCGTVCCWVWVRAGRCQQTQEKRTCSRQGLTLIKIWLVHRERAKRRVCRWEGRGSTTPFLQQETCSEPDYYTVSPRAEMSVTKRGSTDTQRGTQARGQQCEERWFKERKWTGIRKQLYKYDHVCMYAMYKNHIYA